MPNARAKLGYTTLTLHSDRMYAVDLIIIDKTRNWGAKLSAEDVCRIDNFFDNKSFSYNLLIWIKR